MIHRIEISPLPQWHDARGASVKQQVKDFFGITVDAVRTRDVYTISGELTCEDAVKAASLLYNPVLQCWSTGSAKSENYTPMGDCDYLIAVGFRPGVTDNVGRSAKAALCDILGRTLGENEYAFSSVEYLISGKISAEEADTIARKLLANELIQSVTVLTGEEAAKGVPENLPLVTGAAAAKVRLFDLEVSDEELCNI